MQLLVSVRSAAEVGPALSGGADIIDAKEPDRGSLGPVSPATLAEILAVVPLQTRPFSIALGDLASDGRCRSRAIASIALPVRAAPTYLKLGFAGVRSPETVTSSSRDRRRRTGRQWLSGRGCGGGLRRRGAGRNPHARAHRPPRPRRRGGGCPARHSHERRDRTVGMDYPHGPRCLGGGCPSRRSTHRCCRVADAGKPRYR